MEQQGPFSPSPCERGGERECRRAFGFGFGLLSVLTRRPYVGCRTVPKQARDQSPGLPQKHAPHRSPGPVIQSDSVVNMELMGLMEIMELVDGSSVFPFKNSKRRILIKQQRAP